MTTQQAETAIIKAARLVDAIVCAKDDVGVNKSVVQKAQRRYGAIVELLVELISLDGIAPTEDLASRIEKTTSEASRFFNRPSA